MDMQRKLAICSLWLHFVILLHKHNLSAECMELRRRDSDTIDCLFEDRDSCNTAEKNLCKWCELSQKCYPMELIDKVGANRNRFSRRKLKQVQDCSDIIYKDECKSLEHCRWCKSEVLDDGCFKAWESRRLPVQVFDCSYLP
eukprot:c16492_g1_i2 orf=214-639(-)